ncbi:MAG TPA: hypothetical protein VLU99_08370 [Nitrososphaerales archaeon]|nr:hypothetical protein [Nitrososphaerales archaeon]HUK75793.1 hypothetical protein [Nitrososphaerales archaeon]
MTPEQPPGPPARRNTGSVLGLLALVLASGIVVASFGPGLLVPTARSTSTSGAAVSSVTSSASSAASSPTSPPPLCAGLTAAQILANSKAANATGTVPPAYDEQMLMGFEQNFTSGVSYNVTLRAQNDTFGFGPAYLLNGLTDSGYWYQVGVAWDLGTASGGRFVPGFRFVYEVWDTQSGASVYPRNGGTLPARFLANDGDAVLLTLNMTQDGQVAMTASDWNTSSRASAYYGAFGASEFLGFKDKVTSYPTSLLTEWYHVVPYLCDGETVVYSNSALALASAWMRIDEWNLTGVSTTQFFNSTAVGACCVFDTGTQGVGFSAPAVYESVSTSGTTIYSDAHEFVTP